MVDCAGHTALAQHGCAILERGIDLITVSLGALADPALADGLARSAQAGGGVTSSAWWTRCWDTGTTLSFQRFLADSVSPSTL